MISPSQDPAETALVSGNNFARARGVLSGGGTPRRDSKYSSGFGQVNKLSPQALWLLGSLLLVFGAFGANSGQARGSFIAGFQPIEAVLVWLAAWSIIASTAFLGFAFLSRALEKAVADWVLAGSLFVGIFGLVQMTSILSTPFVLSTLNFWRLLWVAPFFGLLGSLVMAGAMFGGFLLYRRILQGAPNFEPFSLSIAVLISGAYFGILSFFLPDGVNQGFTSNVWPLLWGGALLLFSGSAFAGRSISRTAAVSKFDVRQVITSLLLGLVPMVPIIRYLVSNTELVSLGVATFVFAVAAGWALVAVIAIPLVLAPWVDQKIHSVTASAGLYVFYSMASISQTRAWYREGSLGEQIAALFIVFVVLVMFSQLSNRLLSVVVIALLALEIILPLWASTSSPQDSAEASGTSQQFEWEDDVNVNSWVSLPNVYLLVFESYANEESIASYGVDNSEQIDYLLDSGFTIYDGTYSVAAGSLPSMATALGLSDNIANERRATSGDSVVNRIFQMQGYDTHGVFPSDYYFRGFSPKYSSFFPAPEGPVSTATSFAESVLRGEFRFEGGYISPDYSEYLQEKRRVLGLDSGNPVFLHTHNKFPGHSQNSGACRLDETEQYASGLEEANREMALDIMAIDDLDEAIIIIAGDHGPYLTKNCRGLGEYSAEEISRLDVQDRYGSFLAIRWPADLRDDLELQILQDIFPAVFSTLTGSESVFEEARIPSQTLGSAAGSVRVMEGVLEGGQHDGERLFRETNRRIGR